MNTHESLLHLVEEFQARIERVRLGTLKGSCNVVDFLQIARGIGFDISSIRAMPFVSIVGKEYYTSDNIIDGLGGILQVFAPGLVVFTCSLDYFAMPQHGIVVPDAKHWIEIKTFGPVSRFFERKQDVARKWLIGDCPARLYRNDHVLHEPFVGPDLYLSPEKVQEIQAFMEAWGPK